jgi:hypothetical protein
MDGTAKVVCMTVSGIITALVLGEVFGNAISRPIAVWRGTNVSAEKIGTLFDVMNQRICNLEEKKEEEAE